MNMTLFVSLDVHICVICDKKIGLLEYRFENSPTLCY